MELATSRCYYSSTVEPCRERAPLPQQRLGCLTDYWLPRLAARCPPSASASAFSLRKGPGSLPALSYRYSLRKGPGSLPALSHSVRKGPAAPSQRSRTDLGSIARCSSWAHSTLQSQATRGQQARLLDPHPRSAAPQTRGGCCRKSMHLSPAVSTRARHEAVARHSPRPTRRR